MPRRADNKRFAKELRDIIDEGYDGNMAEYSRQSKVAPGTLGHYLTSNRYPTPERLEAMVKPLRADFELRLLEAFMLDLIPPTLRTKVKIHPAGRKTSLQPVTLDPDLGVPARTRRALEFLGRLGSENQAIRTMLEQTAKAMGWKE